MQKHRNPDISPQACVKLIPCVTCLVIHARGNVYGRVPQVYLCHRTAGPGGPSRKSRDLRKSKRKRRNFLSLVPAITHAYVHAAVLRHR